jgi:hypothetical protein
MKMFGYNPMKIIKRYFEIEMEYYSTMKEEQAANDFLRWYKQAFESIKSYEKIQLEQTNKQTDKQTK